MTFFSWNFVSGATHIVAARRRRLLGWRYFQFVTWPSFASFNLHIGSRMAFFFRKTDRNNTAGQPHLPPNNNNNNLEVVASCHGKLFYFVSFFLESVNCIYDAWHYICYTFMKYVYTPVNRRKIEQGAALLAHSYLIGFLSFFSLFLHTYSEYAAAADRSWSHRFPTSTQDNSNKTKKKNHFLYLFS